MAGAVETQNADEATGGAVDRVEAALCEVARDDVHLVVGSDTAGHLDLAIVLIGPEPRDRNERFRLIVTDQQVPSRMGTPRNRVVPMLKPHHFTKSRQKQSLTIRAVW